MEGIPEESGSALPIRQRMRNVTRRIRGMFPVRAAAVDGDNEHILDGGGRMSIGRFLNTHKRKLIIGGAVLGGAAVIGGTVGGILSAKRGKTMQIANASEPAGMFQQLSSGSSGGGGGGGSGRSYARFNQIQAAARHYVRRKKRGGKRRGGKKHYKKQGKKRSHKKTKKSVRHGRVGKRKGKKAIHSINKRRKSRKGKSKTAF